MTSSTYTYSANKVMPDSKHLLEALKRERALGRTIVTTNGVFDILHPGHIASFEFAKGLDEKVTLIVLINADESVRLLNKAPNRPINLSLHRARVAAAIWCVDYVLVFDELTPESLLNIIKPDMHVKSSEYQDRPLPERKIIETQGGRIVFAPHTATFSTTLIIEKIADNQQ